MSNVTQAFHAYLRATEADRYKYLEEEEEKGLSQITPSLENIYNTTPQQPVPQPGELPLTIQQKQQQQLPITTEDILYSPVGEVFEHPKFRTGKKYSLSDLEKDPEFQMRSERFMESIGDNEDIFEYLRDPNFSVTQAFQRSIDIGKWSDESKQDYLWLQEIFENAELGGFKQTMGMVKDLTIDLVTDPFNLLALLFAGPTFGATAAVKASLTKATAQGLKKLTKSSVKRLERVGKGRSAEVAKRMAKYGMAEGAAFTGPHDYFLQDAEKELGLRENIDLTQTAISTGIGAALGGILGGGIGFSTAYSPVLRSKIYNYANEGAIISQAKGTNRLLEKEKWEVDNMLHTNNEDSLVFLHSGLPVPPDAKIIESGKNWWKQQTKKKTPTRKKVEKEGKKPDPSTAHASWLQKALLGYFGKSVSELALGAENSATLQKFLSELRYDWNHTLTKGVQKVEAYTFDENVTRSQGSWMTIKEQVLQPLFRATYKDGDTFKGKVANLFSDNLDYDQNAQLVHLIWNPEATQITYKAADGITDVIVPITKVHDDVINAAKGIKELTDTVFGEALDAGLVTREQLIENYFPRQFQYEKIIANKGKFISILEDSTHSAPVNDFSKSAYVISRKYLTEKGKLTNATIKELEARKIKSGRPNKRWTTVTENNVTLGELKALEKVNVAFIGRNAKWVDEELFQTDFLYQAMFMNKKSGGLGWSEKQINKVYDRDLGQFIEGVPYEQAEKLALVKAKRLKAEALTENILAKREAGYFDTAYLDAINFKTSIKPGAFQSRVFTEIDDETFEEFLDTNVNRVYSDYIIGSARAIERTKMFGKSESVFQDRFIDPMRAELQANGVSFEDRQHILNKALTLYKRTTGLENPTWETIVKGDLRTGKAIRSATDWAKISQQLAHLPLATLSSITEPLILLSRINNPNIVSKEGATAFKDIGHALVKGIKKDLDRWGRVRSKLTGKKVRGLKDIGDEEWQELYKVGLALEQSTMDRLQGLYGEAPKGAFAKGVQNAFFHANLLTQWTGAVQLAAFTTGKRLIRENAEAIYNHHNGIAKLSQKEFTRRRNRLWEAGITGKRAVKWYEQALDSRGQFDESLAQGLRGSKELRKSQLGFYHNYYQRGAARFAKEIILTPTTSAANRPLWHSHPAGQLLAQFAGYPTAFNNTILKRFVQEVYTDPLHASPKIVATTLLMTSVAVLGNALRSQGDSLEGDPGDIVAKGIQRWGGMGPLEVAYRYKLNAGFGSGQMGSLLKAPAGPLAQDAIDMILYRKGLAEMGAANLPGSAAFQMIAGDKYRDWLTKKGKAVDKATWGRFFGKQSASKPAARRSYYGYAIGGVVNIPNAKDEPDEKIDRMTGLPYNLQAGVLGQDEEERFGFALGGIGRVLSSAAARRIKKPITAYHGSWRRFDEFDPSKIGTGQGAAAYTEGLYFAEAEDVAKHHIKYITQDKENALLDIFEKLEHGITERTTTGKPTGQKIFIEQDYKKFVNKLTDDENLNVQTTSVFNELIKPKLKVKAASKTAPTNFEVSLSGTRIGELTDKELKNISKDIKKSMYKVRLHLKKDEILDYDKPLNKQPKAVQNRVLKIIIEQQIENTKLQTKGQHKLSKKKISDLKDFWSKRRGRSILEHFKIRYVELEDLKSAYDKKYWGTKQYSIGPYPEESINTQAQNLQKAGIKALRYKDGYSRGIAGGTANYVVYDPRVIELAKRYGISIPAAAVILYQQDFGEGERMEFAEGGMPTTRNDDEVISMLTRDIQKAAPYLDAGEAIEIYSKEEIKGYPKGITQTVYRNLEEGSDIESLEQFDLTDEIGVHVDTKKQIRKQAGKVRLYNSLDLRQRQVENFKGATFIQTLIDREEVKNTIIKHSKLTKEEAKERIKDLISDYQSTIKAVKAEDPVDVERVNYAMNVKLSQEARSILNELGYDSILYNKEGATSAILFEQGQFRATESPPPSTSVTQEQMNNLGFERKGFASGGVLSRVLANLLSKRNTKLLAKYKNHPEVKGITDAIDKLQKDIGTTMEKNPKIREFIDVDHEMDDLFKMVDELPEDSEALKRLADNIEFKEHVDNLDKRWQQLESEIDHKALSSMTTMKNQIHKEANDMDGLLNILDDTTISSVDEWEVAFDKWKTSRGGLTDYVDPDYIQDSAQPFFIEGPRTKQASGGEVRQQLKFGGLGKALRQIEKKAKLKRTTGIESDRKLAFLSEEAKEEGLAINPYWNEKTVANSHFYIDEKLLREYEKNVREFENILDEIDSGKRLGIEPETQQLEKYASELEERLKEIKEEYIAPPKKSGRTKQAGGGLLARNKT